MLAPVALLIPTIIVTNMDIATIKLLLVVLLEIVTIFSMTSLDCRIRALEVSRPGEVIPCPPGLGCQASAGDPFPSKLGGLGRFRV